MPTTEALMPFNAAFTLKFLRKVSQKGRIPKVSKNAGKKMAIVANMPPCHPWMTVPIYAENVNSGPGIACAAPYPARNSCSLYNPDETNSCSNNGKTTCPPPKTRDPAR